MQARSLLCSGEISPADGRLLCVKEAIVEKTVQGYVEGCGGGPGKHHDPAGGGVQPVHRPDAGVPSWARSSSGMPPGSSDR